MLDDSHINMHASNDLDYHQVHVAPPFRNTFELVLALTALFSD